MTAPTPEHEERYGQWGGNPKGNPCAPERCAEEVFPSGVFHSAQCSRKRGHGPHEAYCKQHAKGKQQ